MKTLTDFGKVRTGLQDMALQLGGNNGISKDDVFAGLAPRSVVTDATTYLNALRAIHQLMSGKEWTPDTHESMRDILDSVGLKVRNFRG
jgi:hypothetical protein